MKRSDQFLTALALLVAGCSHDGVPARLSCIPGRSESCACSDGRQGAQRCLDDGSFDACVCDGDLPIDLAVPREPGDLGVALDLKNVDLRGADLRSVDLARRDQAPPMACTRSDGGVRRDGGSDAGTDVCDGVDNDEDGIIDEGRACDAATVKAATPFEGGVYFLGTTAEGSCGSDALQRFYPSLANDYWGGFDCYADFFVLRRSDAHIFYFATFSGIHEDGAMDPVVPTPPCDDRVAQRFDFDGMNRLHYLCGDTVRISPGGAIVAQTVQSLSAVLDDGRMLVTRASNNAQGSDLVVLGADGSERSRLAVRDEFPNLNPDVNATTVVGNRAWVLLYGDYYSTAKNDAVVFALDECDGWTQMRRLHFDNAGYWRLVISDGTVFVRENDPLTTFDEQIRAYKPDGSSPIVWREANVKTVRAHIGDEMLIGPP